jgi:ketosteroid isomerase-like protein
VSFAALLAAMTDAACRGDGAAVAACFTPDGVYHDCFYGAFTGAAIAEMIEDRFHRDARDFRWDLHDVVDDGRTGYARYVFSYTSKLPQAEGRRAMFEGVSLCRLRDGRLESYREVANSAVGLLTLGFAPDRIAKFLAREARELAARDEATGHA